jgi:hypothetical protein
MKGMNISVTEEWKLIYIWENGKKEERQWPQVLAKDTHLPFLVRHQPCYANIIIISFNVFLISLYYKNKANNKMPLPTCDKWHKGKQILKCHYIHHTRDTWHQVCFSSITARHSQVYIMNTADVLHETVKAYPSRAPVVIVAPLFFSHIYINFHSSVVSRVWWM